MAPGAPTAAESCSYDPFRHEVIADPYPLYQQLLAELPVLHATDHDVWVLGGYDDVRSAARDHGVFSSADGVAFQRMGPSPTTPGSRAWWPGTSRPALCAGGAR